MIINENVRGTQESRPLAVEQNGQTVYIRNNVERKSEKDEMGETVQFWEYDEIIMTLSEYDSVRAGRLIGMDWTDALRAVERSALYDHADTQISKYSTDASDAAMRQAWVDYKAGVRATQSAKGYPQSVSYPAMPE